MKYFIAKIQYQEPVPDKETVKKIKKNLLVRAESVTEVEIRVTKWFPANWQDALVKAVSETPIQELIFDTSAQPSESWWTSKVLFEDIQTGKWTPYILAVNGSTIDKVLPKIRNAHSMSEVDAIIRLKVEIDEDLTKDELQ